MKQNIYIKRLDGNTQPAPKRETEGSAGYDLRALGNHNIKPGERKLIDTGFAWRIPHNMVGLIKPRSGLAYRVGLDVLAGVIDSDYRGEVKILLINLGDEVIEIKEGERIAQMVITPIECSALVEIEDLDESNRDGGFGSTGMA